MGVLIVVLLEPPNSTYSERIVLIVVVLVAIVEVLIPRVVSRDLGGTPIVVASKTTHNVL